MSRAFAFQMAQRKTSFMLTAIWAGFAAVGWGSVGQSRPAASQPAAKTTPKAADAAATAGAAKKAAPPAKAEAAPKPDATQKPGWTANSETGSVDKPAPPAPAASAVTSTAFDDWVLQCAPSKDGKTVCALMQRLADQQGRQIIKFTAARANDHAYLEVSAPLGLSIPYGVSLVLPDKSEVKMQLADCLTAGCRAVVPLEQALLVKLSGAERIGVRFQDSRSGKVLTVSGSLKGFASGMAKVLEAG